MHLRSMPTSRYHAHLHCMPTSRCNAPAKQADTSWSRSFLSENLHRVLADVQGDVSQGVCLSFLVQPQQNPCEQSVDDSTTAWTTKKFKVGHMMAVRCNGHTLHNA